ncbi:hypothetical protein N7468_001973 [Penicillium chermesinum]|uniref:Uncharacterized protein n=1 Tax=Penicillium chermesinum TaxID=63820 RepID=A0A9W9PHR3_9EURO|nr:uncharacterized protein N7468_001973 [Penicillium chermesinum]KAJ5246990.1 hypothetical protein N7468_001973 [Penicillium chermesinum]KAJ6145241.1 hypothetical protein N7470_009136 [Penicillium chermesinum]
MAIFDSEKRPKGLRMPTLTAMKNGAAASKSQFSLHRTKSEPKSPGNDIGAMPLPAAVPLPPPQRHAPPSKELPPPPKDQVPPPPKRLSKVPPRRKLSQNAQDAQNAQRSPPAAPPALPALPVQPVQPVQPPSQPSPQPAVAPSPVGLSPSVSPPQVYSAEAQVSEPKLVRAEAQLPAPPAAPQPVRPGVPAVVSQTALSSQEYFPLTPAPPVTLSPAPPRESDNETPLEDFIPTPDGTGSPYLLEPASSNEQPPYFTPPEMDPVAPELNVTHYNCFQEHRNMPTAQNVWCPLPCMTCQKFDRETRHRCVFCCLRICESCYQGLQKCRHRSLQELLSKVVRA